jgi:iron complex outermembrane receptor protein
MRPVVGWLSECFRKILMRKNRLVRALALAFPFFLPCAPVGAQTQAEPAAVDAADEKPVKSLGVVTVTSGQPTSLPTQIPTTFEGATRDQIDKTVNAYDSSDALKYFPSLLVRKRYIGDYNHAMLSSRASGTGQSPRSLVYADGIPLSNLLGSGVSGLTYAPRWDMVAPEEIERVDVMYGPFSAAYPGNSVGAVVDYVTRMPTEFEANVKLAYQNQPFKLYHTDKTYEATQGAFSLGNQNGDWHWFVNFDHTDSEGQPLTFATLLKTNTTGTAGTPVTGAVSGKNSAEQPWYVIGTGTQYHSIQDHAKLKLAYDISSTLQASYILGLWQNDAKGRPETYLRDAAGNPVYSGPVTIDGKNYSIGSTAFAMTNEDLLHVMHGLSLKSHTQGVWDWELAASLYDYAKDEKRSSGSALPAASSGGPGTIADGSGSGWNTLALKGTWRPQGLGGAHVVDMGLEQDSGKLDYEVRNITGSTSDWRDDDGGALASSVGGNSRLQSAWAQDAWRFAPKWMTVLGLRTEQWSVYGGRTDFSATSSQSFADRDEFYLSPKAALSYQWLDDTVLKASLGRAVRMPTLSELYGATTTTNSQFVNDPDLKPEKSWTTELGMEKDVGAGLLRLTFFAEETRDGIYSQYTYDTALNGYISRITNVDLIQTKGLELAFNGSDVGADFGIKGLDFSGSVTWADSEIVKNSGYVKTPGDTLGKQQPNIPQWRATALASYQVDGNWSVSGGVRYSGRQYRTLDNSDVYGYTYMGVSEFLVADLRARYQVGKQWTASFGIDNVTNDEYWNFHPYPQRSYSFDLSWKY